MNLKVMYSILRIPFVRAFGSWEKIVYIFGEKTVIDGHMGVGFLLKTILFPIVMPPGQYVPVRTDDEHTEGRYPTFVVSQHVGFPVAKSSKYRTAQRWIQTSKFSQPSDLELDNIFPIQHFMRQYSH